MTAGKRLHGKVAIVTGGASGIGEATVRLFVEHGAQVVITDIDAARGRRIETELGAESTIFRTLNVTSEEDWSTAITETQRRWGRLNIIVNNAGMSGAKGRATVEDIVTEDWNEVFAVNSTGVMLGTKAAISAMRKSGGGSVVNVSSIFGIVGSRAAAAYHASKGAVRSLTKAAAVQSAKYNIRVNSVHPGFTDTPMTLDVHSDPQIRQSRLDMIPLGRFGKPEDIAYGILYLASDEARWVTGTELIIDGGQIAW